MTKPSHRNIRAESWRAVVEAYQVCHHRYGAALDHLELTIPQFEVLLAIRMLAEDATPKRIADQLLVTKGNVTGVTSRLLSRGLIAKSAHQSDGRSLVFRLTRRGDKLTNDASKVAGEFIRQQLAPFNDQEVELVGDIMSRMKTHLLSMSPEVVVNAALGKRRTK